MDSFWMMVQSLMQGHLHFKWPWLLLLLPLLLALPLLYRRHQVARLQRAVKFSYTDAAKKAFADVPRWKRLALPALLFSVFTLLTVSLARPTVVIEVPVQSVDMVLVVDISLSMKAADINPTRLEAMKEAGRLFIESLPKGFRNDVRVGLVFFAGTATPVHVPTKEHGRIRHFLETLTEEQLEPSTALGSSIQASVNMLEQQQMGGTAEGVDPLETRSNDAADESKKHPQRVIVLLSDGDQNTGYPWDIAAENARRKNIKVHTIAIGSQREDVTIEHEGTLYPVHLDDRALKRIAEITDGQFYRAFKKSDFQNIYRQVRERSITFERQDEELSAWLSGLALLLLALYQGVSAYRFKRQ